VVHSIISPSSAKTLLSCRPSPLVPPAAGGDGDNSYTTQGDAAHQLIEQCGRARYELDQGVCGADYVYSCSQPSTFLGTQICGVTVDAEMVRDANIFLQEVGRIMDANPGAEVFFERRIVHSRVPEFGGTMDCLIVTADALWVLDFKFGMGQTVEVQDNPQLLCYILLAMNEFGRRKDVHACVVQTRKPHPDGPVRSWSPDYQTVDEFANCLMICIQEYRENHRRQEAGHPVHLELIDKYEPTEDNCRFCSGKANCPALQGMLKEYTMETQFDPTYVARVLETEFLVRKHIDAVKSQAEAEMANGNKVPGFKRTTKFGNRRWDQAALSANKQEFTGELMTLSRPHLGTVSVLLLSGKLRSPAQLEKAGVPRDVFEHLVERPITGVRVVPLGSFGDDLDSEADTDAALAAAAGCTS